MVYLGIAEGIKGHHFMRTANNQLFTATTPLFDKKLFPKCKTSAPKPITQVREPVLIDTLQKTRNIPWNDDNDFPFARKSPNHLIIPPVPIAGPPAPPAPPAAPPPPALFTPMPYKKHIVLWRQGALPRPPSMPP